VPLLTGTRVLACENGLAGPLCSRLLADLGADVVKVERPGVGDVTRGWDSIARGESSGFVWMNRGKRSVALDLKDPSSRPALEALVRASDVFLQNFTPGWAADHGVDEPAVRALRPDIVYTEISGYGPDGPYAERNAYDLVVQGETGLISITGTPEEPARVGVSICDVGAGSYAAVATAAALARRAQTGEGERVSISLFDTMVDWLGYFPHQWWHRHEVPPRTGMRHPHFCPYGPFPAGDGKTVMLGLQNEREWVVFCERVLARPELVADERFSSNSRRTAHRQELREIVVAAFAQYTAAQVIARLDEASIANARMNDMGDVWEHPQLAARQRWSQVDTSVGPIRAAIPPGLPPDPPPRMDPVPALGQHTDAILRELGYDPASIAQLRGAKAI